MATGAVTGWFDRHDPTRYATHRGFRVAIAVTAVLPLSWLLFSDAQFTLFAAFGSLAVLIFVDFPGDRSARAVAYVLVGCAGLVLVTVGTLVSRTGWLAVSGMAVVGFAVLFAGILSAAIASSSRILLLAFVLPATVPVTTAEILPRLGGWILGMTVAIPLALFLWPAREHFDLRQAVGRTCRGLAAAVGVTSAGRVVSVDDAAEARAVVEAALDDLRRSFRASVSRPIGLSAGGRLLARVVRDLDWLWIETRGAIVSGAEHPGAQMMALGPEVARRSAAVLSSAGDALAAPTPANRDGLTAALEALTRVRGAALSQWIDETLAGRPPADLAVVERLHSTGYATELVGQHVAAALAADARSPIDKILGRPGGVLAPGMAPGTVTAGTRLVRHHLSWRSVWLHNSLRGALGMALAVLLAQVTEVSHGFWVALGAMSVLRSSALNTGVTAFRAVLGTVVGVLLSAAILILLDGNPAAWVLLPLTMFLAGFASDAISFTAGQAAFSLAVLIMFSLLAPTGWEVGLVRVEDVAIGAGAGVVVGLLLWPRGAGGEIRRAMAESLVWDARLLVHAIDRLTAKRPSTEVDPVDVLGASFRLDDALRQYLADRGAKSGDIEDLIAVCVGAERVRLTSEALYTLAERHSASAAGADPGGEAAIAPALAQDFRHRAGRHAHWLETVARELCDDRAGIAPAPPADAVAAVLSDAHRHRDDASNLRRTPVPVWVAIHLDDVARHELRLRPRALALGSSVDAVRDPQPATN